MLAISATGACAGDEHPDPGPPDAAPACGCPYAQAHLAGAVTPKGADELSGLAASLAMPDVVWTHNDRGDSARVFALTTHGAGLGLVVLPNATAVDWEDIAVAPCGGGSCIYVADTGDNELVRASVRIYEVVEPLELRGKVELDYRAFDVTYPDGPHDVEALFVDPRDGASYVITKEVTSPATVYRMPRTPGSAAVASMVASLVVPSGDLRITAADLHVDACGVRLLVRTYSSLWELSAPPGASIPDLLAAPPASVPVAVEPQGEAVTYLPSGHAYLTVSDGPQPRISRAACE